ncbi:glycosyltransferase [Rossellomorea vietnamensis]|uniref:glycosyltransferase n=1 Tax=Rossellomorea vietnamensis TaxID=218284 RepID=UPI000552FD3A|nr:glycosyltransferase [Rossellomorea vietnamensis]
MSEIDFYFIDNINFHKRGFNNFISFVEENYSYQYNKAFPMLKKSFGKYNRKNIEGLNNFNNLEVLFLNKTHSELEMFNFKGYNLWEIITPELKSYIVPKIYEKVIEENLDYTSFEFQKMLDTYHFEEESLKNSILHNMIVGAFWIEYWAKEFKRNNIKNVCVFGGTSTYSRAATLVAQWNNINVIAFEGSFIKKFHYADNSSGVITNNHKFSNRSLWTKLEGRSLLPEQKKWLANEFKSKSNLNVVQPKELSRNEIYERYNIPSDKKIILLIGQVINDYSLTKDLKTFASVIDFYLETIKLVGNLNDYHLFIKLHPWENYKQNSSANISKRILEYLLSSHGINNFTIDYEVNMDSLINVAEFGITSCSQAGLEMLYQGKRVIQVGGAFYGNKGWTIDVTQKEFLEQALNICKENPTLTTKERNEVSKFIYHLLKEHNFVRSGEDENFLFKFNQVTNLDSINKMSDSSVNYDILTNSDDTKSIIRNNNYIRKIKKGLKNPNKMMKKISKKSLFKIKLTVAKMKSQKIVNMVMGASVPSKIFEDMIRRFEKGLGSNYYVVVTNKPIPEADLYHYWRPNLSKEDIKSPSITTVHHDFDRDSESLSLRHYLESYKKSDMILCLNEQQKNRLKDYVDLELKVIPHGFDESFVPKSTYKKKITPENKLVIGFCSKRYGRLVKGEETLYKVIESLKDENVKYIFIGNGRKKEHDFCEKMGVESEYYENLDYSHFPEIYSKMDIFLIASKAEGGPASLPEAMATGLPVVSTPCGFVPDLLTDGVNGFIVDYDDNQGFVSAINKFIKNPRLLKSMGTKARESESLYTWSEIVGFYETAYKELLNNK